MTYHERAEEILKDWSMSGLHHDDETGHVDEAGFWAARFDGPPQTQTVFHVCGLPAAGYTWQTAPLRDLEETYDCTNAADALRTACNLKIAGIVPDARVQTIAPDADAIELAALHPAAVGFILECDERAIYYYRAYTDRHALEYNWAVLERADTENRGPQEEDATIYSNGFVLSVACGSDFLGEFSEDSDARAELRRAMERAQYWPNVWQISDHGNALLISEDFYKETDHLAGGKDA